MARRNFSGWITEDAKELLIDASARSHPIETGGIIAGVFVDGRPWITHVKEIPSDERGHATYVIPAGETSPALAALRASDARVGYLGDWHSHPANVGASSLDFGTMKWLTHDGDVPAPLLVIVRRDNVEGYVVETHQWGRHRSRRVQLAKSGPLPQPGNAQEPTRELKKARNRG